MIITALEQEVIFSERISEIKVVNLLHRNHKFKILF